MKRNGMQVLNFRVPALVEGQLAYVHGKQFVGRVAALCFVPYAGLITAQEIDRQALQFQKMEASLLIVISGARPLHRLWVDQPEKPWTPILTDPCGRLHRSFGVTALEESPRCRTFVIDREGILRLRVTHDFVDSDLDALRKIVGLHRLHAANGGTSQETTADINMEYSPV